MSCRTVFCSAFKVKVKDGRSKRIKAVFEGRRKDTNKMITRRFKRKTKEKKKMESRKGKKETRRMKNCKK
jgi:hypothetical protein